MFAVGTVVGPSSLPYRALCQSLCPKLQQRWGLATGIKPVQDSPGPRSQLQTVAMGLDAAFVNPETISSLKVFISSVGKLAKGRTCCLVCWPGQVLMDLNRKSAKFTKLGKKYYG